MTPRLAGLEGLEGVEGAVEAVGLHATTPQAPRVKMGTLRLNSGNRKTNRARFFAVAQES